MKFSVCFRFVAFVVSFSFCGFAAAAQDIAVTLSGDTVVLYRNGKWDYKDNLADTVANLTINETLFTRPASYNKRVEGAQKRYEVAYDPSIWKRTTFESNDDVELAFKTENGECMAMTIYETVHFPVLALADIAVENAQAISSDMHLTSREFRIVNNDTVVYQRVEGTSRGIDFVYHTYIATNEHGSLQFHAFTLKQVLAAHEKKMFDLLNSLVIKD